MITKLAVAGVFIVPNKFNYGSKMSREGVDEAFQLYIVETDVGCKHRMTVLVTNLFVL